MSLLEDHGDKLIGDLVSTLIQTEQAFGLRRVEHADLVAVMQVLADKYEEQNHMKSARYLRNLARMSASELRAYLYAQ